MPWGARRAPRWLVLVLGAAAIVAGAVLLFRPFDSLAALTALVGAGLILAGLGEIVSAAGDDDPWPERIVGAVLVVTGIVALALPSTTVRAVAIAVGIGLVVGGAARIVAGLRRGADERYASIVGGLAGVVLGILSLAWPDVSILVVGLLVGPLAIVFGAVQVVRALRGARRDEEPAAGAPRPGWRRFARAIAATAALVVAFALVGVSAAINEGSPEVDDFYAAPDEVPTEAGRLVRSEGFERSIPDRARAWRILYTTTATDGSTALASGLVVAPRDDAGPLPVVAWNHGTTGVARACAPSVLDDPWGAGAFYALEPALERGWAVVAPDYPGLAAEGADHPYLVGVPAGRSALDAVRAARRVEGLDLGAETVAWGHSQGGGAALWTGVEAASYAPDVPLSGVAALAPASDVLALAESLQSNPAGQLFASFVVEGYSDHYPDVAFEDYVRPTAQRVVRAVVGRCLSEPATILSLGAVLPGEDLYRRPLVSGALGERLAENVPARPTGIPTLLAQGLDDQLVLPAVQRLFVERLCAAGQAVDFRTFAGRDHVPLVTADSPLVPQLMEWTEARFAGAPVPEGCTTTEG